MKETVLYLLRHGAVANTLNLIYGRVRDIPLSAQGREQMRSLGMTLKERGEIPHICLVSSLNRTKESAQELLSQFPPIPVQYKDELQETDSSDFVGRPLYWARNLEDPYDINKQFKYRYWLEGINDQIKRMKFIIDQALAEHQGEIIVVISHGDPLAFYLHSLLYPGVTDKTIRDIKNELYLLRGEAWRLTINDNTITAKERLRPSKLDTAIP